MKEIFLAEEIDVKVYVDRDVPNSSILLKNAKIITMNGDEIIENGQIYIKNNRIIEVSNSDIQIDNEDIVEMDMQGKNQILTRISKQKTATTE